MWHNAIWHDRAYHFVVPSGYHADKFVRIGDIFVDPLNVARVADWCVSVCASPCVLVADSFTLLPLLQELELRLLRRLVAEREERPGRRLTLDGYLVPKFIVPLYGVPEDEVRARSRYVSTSVPHAREMRTSGRSRWWRE